MKFFVDTADTTDIAELAATGLLDGVTTNPSLIAKSGLQFVDVVKEICALVDGPVSAEVVALDHAGMMREAEVLRKIADNVCVKVPLTLDGLKTCKALTEILVASVRHPVHILESARIGADVMTAPPAVIKALFNHPLTDKGIAGFMADWAKTGQTIA